jgi:tRNA threonylcarbamoyladenosine biosynthesis protein TsaE
VATASPEGTEALGRRLGARLRAGDLVALAGPLGSGKTVLARGLALGAGARGYIASPSFVVVREYEAPVRIYHVDLYRIERAEDLRDLGLDDLMDGSGIVIVEWADRAPALLASALWIECALGASESDRVYTLRIPDAMGDRLWTAGLGPAGEA